VRQSVIREWWRRALVGLAGVLVVLLAACQAGTVSPMQVNGNGNETTLKASGVIQTEEISIASEFGGRIAEIPVAEGDEVAAGDLLVRLDTTLLDAQIETVEATVAMAEAGLAQAKAGARLGQITVAEAQLAQAEAGLAAAQQAVTDTQALVENPQDIDLQIAVMAAQIESAQHKSAQAVAFKDAAEIAQDAYWDGMEALQEAKDQLKLIPEPYRPSLPGVQLDMHLIPNLYWQSWVGVNAASAEEEGRKASLAQLYAQRENPQAMLAAADEAQAAMAQAEAQVAAARIQVEAMEAGATAEQIAAMEARVAQARAGRDALLTQREMMYLTAPMDGTVMNIAAHPGEVAAQGATLLTIADIEQVILKVYMPETRIGQVQLGQLIQVTVDSFPDRTFEGRVSYISDQAEFTPRNVATQEERVNLVFAVEIRIANQGGDLKPGMPADAVFGS
jgi:HlyD family secretion protein